MLKKYLHLNSIFPRLLFSFMIIVVPIIIVGVVMLSWEKKTISDQITENTAADMSFLKCNLEKEVQDISSLQYNLTNDRTLQKLVSEYGSMQRFNYYTTISDMQYRLQVMKNSNPYIDDIIVYVPGVNHSLSEENGYELMDGDTVEELMDTIRSAKYHLIFNSNGAYMLMAYPFSYIQEGKTPLYIVKVSLSADNLTNFIDNYRQNSKYETALYDYTSENIVLDFPYSVVKSKDGKEAIANSKGQNLNTSVSDKGENYFVTSIYSKDLNLAFAQFVPMQDFYRIPDRYEKFLWFYIALSALVVVFYSYFTYRLVKRPVSVIVQSFHILEQGQLDTKIHFKAADEFNYLYEEFNNMVTCLNALIDNGYKQQIYAQKAELKQLQSQINPHFFYNSYFILHRMILDQDFDDAEKLSEYLGTYFRYITRNALEEVTLDKEMEHAVSYARIQQMRFGERMGLEIGEVPHKYRMLSVPRMILQPILENSIEHGIDRSAAGGLVRIAFTELVDGLQIIVEDSGSSISEEKINEIGRKLQSTDENEEVTGVVNVHRRLQLKFGPESGLTVSRSAIGGLRTEIMIILKQNRNFTPSAPQNSEKGAGAANEKI